MSKVKLNLKGLTKPEKVELMRRAVTATTGNPNFTTPNPPLASMTTQANSLETTYNTALAADLSATQKHDIADGEEDKLDALFTQFVGYIESTSGGDGIKIKSAGLELRSERTPVGALPAPQNLSVTAGDFEGKLDLGWDGGIRGASSYMVEMSLDAITWTTLGATTKSSFTASGLTSGTKYWFRVAALGANGQGPWSDPATKMAT